MPKSPELIIEEFELRRAKEHKERWSHGLRRACDVGGIAVLVGAILFGTTNKTEIWVPLLVVAFLLGEIQKRWALEDDVRRLKNERDLATRRFSE